MDTVEKVARAIDPDVWARVDDPKTWRNITGEHVERLRQDSLAAARRVLAVVPDYEGMVREFHEKFGHPVQEKPSSVDMGLAELRYELIREEVQDELRPAMARDDTTEIADALGDILYVTFGAALVYGIPIGEIFAEIQRSNMSKLGADGKPIYREDGKILKGPNYSPPNIKAILEAKG